MHGDPLGASDADLADGVAGLGREECLAGHLLEDFRVSGQMVARLPDGYVCDNHRRTPGISTAHAELQDVMRVSGSELVLPSVRSVSW